MTSPQNAPDRVPSFVRSVLYYASLLLFFSFLWAFNALCIAMAPFHRKRKDTARIRRFARAGLRVYFAIVRATGNLTVEYVGFENLAAMRGTVVVGNHPGLLDAFLLLVRSPNFIVLYKASLHDRMVARATTQLTGYIANSSRRESIRAAESKLQAGHNILVFPEGTRTGRWPLLPLNKGYALIAKRANAPIRLISISTRSDTLSKASPSARCPKLPAHFVIRLGEEIDPAGFADIDSLNRHIEAAFWSLLAPSYEAEFAYPCGPAIRDDDRGVVCSDVAVPLAPVFCRGHFPGNPVLPAYAILIFCSHAVRRMLQIELGARTWKNVKFARLISPGDQLQIEVRPCSDGIHVLLLKQGLTCFSGLVTPSIA